jgi:hypothetical protein
MLILVVAFTQGNIEAFECLKQGFTNRPAKSGFISGNLQGLGTGSKVLFLVEYALNFLPPFTVGPHQC